MAASSSQKAAYLAKEITPIRLFVFPLRVYLNDVFGDPGGYFVNPFLAASIRDDIGNTILASVFCSALTSSQTFPFRTRDQ